MKKLKNEGAISENFRKVDIINNFWDICKGCRESFYYLKSLEMLCSIIITIKNELDEKIVKKIKSEYINIEKNYDNLEKKLLQRNINKKNGIAVSANYAGYNRKLCCLSTTELYDFIIKYADLKDNIDRVQIKILDFLIENRDKINNSLAKKDKRLESIYLHYYQDSLLNNALNHSTDEDKIVTYEFNCNGNESLLELKNNDIILPIYKIYTDYIYLFKTRREELKNLYELTLKLMDIDEKLREKIQIKKLNKKQYYFNIIVTIFTVIATITSIWSLTYTIHDHNYNKLIHNNYIDRLAHSVS